MATLQMNILSMKLGMQSNFTVILPSFRPGVDAGKELSELYPRDVRFRTLWLLPSEYGDDIEELHYTSIQRYADETGIAVVMPAPLNRMYSNDPTNQKFIDYITEELWSLGHGTFALSYKKEDNYIGGFSLGAYGALKAALRNTDKYSKVFMIGGVFEENIKDGYFRDINARIAEQGLIPHLPLDDALPGDEELVRGRCLLCFRGFSLGLRETRSDQSQGCRLRGTEQGIPRKRRLGFQRHSSKGRGHRIHRLRR